MKKKYSKKWQRYFVRLLEGEPISLEPKETSTKRKQCQNGILAALIALCGNTEEAHCRRCGFIDKLTDGLCESCICELTGVEFGV